MIKDAKTGQIIPPTVPPTLGVTPPTHDENVLANLKELPFDVQSFIQSVRSGDNAVDPKGGTLSPAERYLKTDAANRIAEAFGYFKTGPNGEHIWDKDAAQNFLNVKNPAFRQLQKFANAAGNTPEDPSIALEHGMAATGLTGSNAFTGPGQALASLGQDRIKGILRNFGGTSMATDTPLQTLGRAAEAASSPSRVVRTLIGDPRADSSLSQGEQAVHTVTDLATWLGSGGTLNAIGEAAGRLATKAAPGIIAKTLTGQLIKNGLGDSAAGMLANQLAIQAPAIAVRAGDLQKQGVDQASAWKQAGTEAASGLAKLPQTLLDPDASPSERINAAALLGLTGLALGGHALGKLGENSANLENFSQIRPPVEGPRIQGTERPEAPGQPVAQEPWPVNFVRAADRPDVIQEPVGTTEPATPVAGSEDPQTVFSNIAAAMRNAGMNDQEINSHLNDLIPVIHHAQENGLTLNGQEIARSIHPDLAQHYPGNGRGGNNESYGSGQRFEATSGGEPETLSGGRGYGSLVASDLSQIDSGRSYQNAPGTRLGVSSEYTPSEAFQAEAQRAGASSFPIHELDNSATSAQNFIDAISNAKNASKFGESVATYDPADYQKMRLFLSPDGKAGFALNDGDIVSVFKHPDGPARATMALIRLATEEGGNRLDAFDTDLPRIYSKQGFKAVARLPWNDDDAPPGWDHSTYSKFNNGRPDVVFMAHDPAYGKLYQAGDGPYVASYDDGVNAAKEHATKQNLGPNNENAKSDPTSGPAVEANPSAKAQVPQEPSPAAEPEPTPSQKSDPFADIAPSAPEPETTPKPEPEPEARQVTGIRKSISDPEAETAGVKLKPQQEYTTPETAHEAGRQAYERAGLENTVNTAKEVSAKPRQLTTTEIGQFEAAHVELLRRENLIFQHLKTLKPESEEFQVESANLRNLIEQHAALQDGIRKGRRENSAGLAAFKMMSNLDDGTYAGARAIAESIKGEPLTAKEDAKLRFLQDQWDKAKADLEAKITELQAKHDQIAKQLADRQVETFAKTSRRTLQRSEIASRKAAAIDRIKKSLVAGQASFGPADSLVEFMGGLKDLALAHIQDGALTLSEVYEKVKTDLEAHQIKVTQRQLHQAPSGLYDKDRRQARESFGGTDSRI